MARLDRPNAVFRPFVEPSKTPLRKPAWVRSAIPSGKNVRELREMLDGLDLHTVCESAKCPNIGECWSHGTATLMILGDICTRSCGFCSVTTGKPTGLDEREPERAAEAVAVSQPGLSGQIQELERRLGVTLFERSSRGVTLTPAGVELIARSRAVLRDVDELVNAAGAFDGELKGRLRVGAIPTAASGSASSTRATPAASAYTTRVSSARSC